MSLVMSFIVLLLLNVVRDFCLLIGRAWRHFWGHQQNSFGWGSFGKDVQEEILIFFFIKRGMRLKFSLDVLYDLWSSAGVHRYHRKKAPLSLKKTCNRNHFGNQKFRAFKRRFMQKRHANFYVNQKKKQQKKLKTC